MFCISNRRTGVYLDLAAEEYLLKEKKGDFFMIWQSVPSVVIRKYQSVWKEADEKYIHENNILLARCFSDGGAVYHDEGNFNLSFMETMKCLDFEYYLQQMVDSFESLDIMAYTDKRMGIYIDDRKVSGSAQCIYKNRVVYHCILLYSVNLQALNAALYGRGDEGDLLPSSCVLRAIPLVRSVVTNISEYLLPAVSLECFAHLLLHFFFERGDNHVYRSTPEDLATVG